jgi:ABC-type phosphate transport system substrate-binding protein
LALLWGNVYADACGLNITTLAGDSTYGAQLACGIADPVSQVMADIGILSRPFLSTEATAAKDGYDFQCVIGTKRTLRQFPVAVAGVTFAFPLNQVAAKCIVTLSGKGLTIQQIRWMYSSYTYSQLVANGWDKSSLPGNDNNDKTHLWSELGGSGCPATEIAIAGPPSTSGTFSFFTSIALTGSGETVALNRPTGYYNAPNDDPNAVVTYLQQHSASIGIFGSTYYALNIASSLGAASVENSAGVYVAPTTSALAAGTYNPFSRQVYMELNRAFLNFQRSAEYVKFGLSSIGDTLTYEAGLSPLSATTKNFIASHNLYSLSIPCFSGSSTVQVTGKGAIAMMDLKIGDWVLNAYGKYDQVYSFGHFGPETEAEYIQIHAEGLKQPLEISKEHMLFVGGVAVPASAVRVGDKLNLVNSRSVVQVRKVQTVIRNGAFAPFTLSGTIAVNDVAASVYVDLQNNAGVLIAGGYKTPITMQFLAHMFQSPHRLVCKTMPSYCRTETYNINGVSAWVSGPLAAAEWVIQQNAMIIILTLVPCVLVGFAIQGIEMLTMASMLLMFVAVAAFFAVQPSRNAKQV